MQMQALPRHSEPPVQPVDKTQRTGRSWLGYERFTLKSVIELLFALLIPVMIGILTIVLQRSDTALTEKNRKNDFVVGQLQRQSDEEQTQALANETVFSGYVKNIADVILYSPAKLENQHWIVTRALTTTALRQINSQKKALLIHFLHSTGILQRGENPLNTNTASDADRHLTGANLDNVDFSDSPSLPKLILRNVRLINGSFVGCDLQRSDFSHSILHRVNFSNANLDGAKFVNVQLQGADFTGSSLRTSQLCQVNLSQSTITDEQLHQALFVFNVLLPNGTWARNRTFVKNGDGQQGTQQWNITEGLIRVTDFSFVAQNQSRMLQRINTTEARIYGSYETFQYCLSLSVLRPDNLRIAISYFDSNRRFLRLDQIDPSESFIRVRSIPSHALLSVKSLACNGSLSSSSTNFCFWSSCQDAPSGSDYLDLSLLFLQSSTTIDGAGVTAVKDIELTISIE